MRVLSDFYVYIRVENRFDLLRKAVDSIPEFHDLLTIVDNSPNGLEGTYPCAVYRPPVPLTFTQTHNWWFQAAKHRGGKYVIWMHADAEAVDNGHLKLLDFMRAETRKWYTIWTNYDSLAAVNLAAIEEVGGYDQHIEKYNCDNDLTWRMKLAGWEAIDSGINTLHLGSSTIKSDSRLNFVNSIVHGLADVYYVSKWGGLPNHEKYTVPYNRPDLFPDLKPVGVW
jgi:hypothetical protein